MGFGPMRQQCKVLHEPPACGRRLFFGRGTVFLFCPLTSRGKEWIDEYVQPDALWFGNTLVVEHRYAWSLAQGMKDAGLVLEGQR